MSHFIVVVIGEDVEEQLAPYSENTEVEEYWEEAGDWTLEYGKEKASENGILEPTLEQIAKYASGEEDDGTKYVVRDGNIMYKTTYNPQSKWDWYEIGGRWTGYFPLKEGRHGIVGRPGLFTKSAEKGFADAAHLCDIDFEGARKEKEKEARKWFTKWMDIVNKCGMPETWSSIRESGISINDARNIYHKQPAIKMAHEQQLAFWDCPAELFGTDEEKYVAKECKGVLVPFSYVKDGEWIERAKMGWFGQSYNDTMTREEWCDEYNEMLKNLRNNTLLTAVDCHI